MDIEVYDHTADVGVRAIAATREGALAGVGLGLFEVLVGRDAISAREEHAIHVALGPGESPVVALLNELVYRHEVHGLLLRELTVHRCDAAAIDATGRGERLRPEHALHTQVKAATYCDTRFEQLADGRWLAQTVLDI